MSSRVPGTYLWEVARQARLARWGWESLQARVAAGDEIPWHDFKDALRRADRMHADVQSILTAAAQISKLLSNDIEEGWSAERKAFTGARSQQVRKVVGSNRPALMKRSLRNAIEHFDSRLDEVLFASPEIGLSDVGVGPTPPTAVDQSVSLRYLAYDSMTFYVLGDSIDLKKLIAEIESVGEKARAWLEARGSRLCVG